MTQHLGTQGTNGIMEPVSTFNRRHYQKIAFMIRTLPYSAEERYLIAAHFAVALQRDYSQFKRSLFMRVAIGEVGR